MRSLRYFFLIVLMGFSIPLFAQHGPAKDSLSNALNMRPNDLIKQESQWNMASTDVFTYRLNGGLYGYYGPQPKTLIDGIPVDINFFGSQNLNMLPILTNNVKGTTSKFSPQVYNNTLANAGLVDFQTAELDTGLTLQSTFYIGNETGDPGPFIFDSLKTTPNIDRWGPDGSFLAAYNQGNWYAKGLFSFRNHQPTDLILNQRLKLTASVLGRNQEFVNYKLQSTTQSGLLETGYREKNWGVKARALYGQDEDYLFLQPFGREIPAKTRYQQVAVEGEYRPAKWILKGRYIAHNKTIDKRYDLHTFIFNWDQTTHTFSTSAEFKDSKFSIKPGIIYERISTKAPGINQPFNDLATFFLDGKFSLLKDVSFNFHSNIDYDENQFSETVRLGLTIKPVKQWQIKPEFFYSELTPLRQNSFTYWVNRGYTFANELGISIDQPLESFRDRSTGIELENKFSIVDGLSLTLEQQFVRHYELNIPWQIVEENEFLDTLPGTFTATSERGSRISFFTKVDNTIADWLNQQFSFQIQHTLSGSDRYREYFEQIPEAKIDYQLNVVPNPNLILSLQTSYQSSTEWREYEALDGVEYILPSGIPIRRFSGTFDTTTPAFTNVTLGVQKWFWNRHISTQFSLQNLLNQEVRTHTLGAELFTKFNIKVGVNL